MTIKTRSTASGTGTIWGSKPFRKRVLTGIGVGALVIAALAGLALHQAWTGSATRKSGKAAETITQPLTAASTGTAIATAPRGLTIYLVDSAAQAQAAYAQLRAENELLFANGAPDREATVRVVTSPQEAAQAREAVATFNDLRHDNGLAPIQLVDLRAANASAVETITPEDPVQPR